MTEREPTVVKPEPDDDDDQADVTTQPVPDEHPTPPIEEETESNVETIAPQ